MNEYRSNIDLTTVVCKVRQADKIAVTTHTKPDGDAFGSVVAMTTALRELGKEVSAWFMPPVPSIFDDLKGRDLVGLYNVSAGLPPSDLVMVLDTGAWSQVSPMRDALIPLLDRTLLVDHHVAGDIPAAWRYVNHEAAACCEIVAQLIEGLQNGSGDTVDLFTPTICEALFAGIASDTGWFRFSNTRAQTHDLAANLIRRGVNHSQMYCQLEQRARPEKLALQIRALESMALHADDRVALMVLRADDFLQTGAMLVETERFVDMPQSVQSVQVVVLITQPPPHHKHGQVVTATDDASNVPAIRLSFRSKPGPHAVDVAKLAGQFGGGGHARAAGAKVKAPLEQVIQQVTAATIAVVGRQP